MPSRKAEKIIQVLRSEILSGQRAPKQKLPTYDALIEQFRVTRPTVARVFQALRSEGLIETSGTRGVFVAETFPHHRRYFWVTSEQPGSLEWTGFLATFYDLIERRETGIEGEVIALVGIDGRVNNPGYQRLADAVQHQSAAGLFLMNSAATYLLPVLQAPGVPRVAIWAPLPHASLLSLDFDALLERACDRVAERGRRVAIMSPHAPNLERAERYLSKKMPKDRIWALHVAAVGCDRITELLLDRKDRPNAIFVTDDNLVTPLLAGFRRAKLRPGKDVYVLAHCNWPRPVGAGEGIEHIGFDVREILQTAKASIDSQRTGQGPVDRTVYPRFAFELPPAKSARSGERA